MEALQRKPNLSVRRSMQLDSDTKIEIVGVPARVTMEIAKNKQLDDTDKGLHVVAAKVRINGKPIVIDDLLNCFDDEELTKIVEFATGEGEDGKQKNG